MRVFIDTNLWVYRLDHREPVKAKAIQRWLRTLASGHEIVVSTQVLIELRSVISRKFKPAFSADDIRLALEALANFEVVATEGNLVLDAHALAVSEGLAWFDALIAEAAIRSGCQVLYSEDFSHGRLFSGVEVCNPLLEA
ncbi:PIN domain-containing protein [Synechococcus sp. J7-Johnson]|uniref:PIN domain-containing protein n=1 Tax=Synechococcus sp. J7-Johnson TaxID=2823737 RepID=UPI0020CFB900|nr:PIN domain-containing protein [Synechococcus sp. J7-Johnson]MCP9841977.1 PIN domain-containing protein [Synechococcus sp. J7-Johnson]